ncbi:hypothetical protein [Actinoplanes aureus]|uniref:Uncharacterized protein n=1 Tax=Actinoplanes aureus TaxID=2792083 RepID=A0A931G5A4_9ACTN|nr:hypothetical protein [Actinoplanes aureus]MBG0568696.1 hypothetical protein [Actinoplanes aureus]
MSSAVFSSRYRSYSWQVVGVVAVAGLSLLAWFAWLGWDQEYHVDPSTGVASGPYEVWQVAGCALSLLVLLLGALMLRLSPVSTSAALTLAFTAVWTVDAASSETTGLYGVGTLMLLVGLASATAVVSVAFLHLRAAARSR